MVDRIILWAFLDISRTMAIESYKEVDPFLGKDVFVHTSATVIGDVELADRVSVWPGVVIRGDVNLIRIGEGSNIQDNSVLHVTHRSPRDPDGAPLYIGKYVTVGHACILHGCEIGDECLIGMGAIVMDRAVLQPRVLLGAGSLVPEGRILESGWLYVGRPAKPVRPLTEEEIAGLHAHAVHYVEWAAGYLP
jgi:carbonic anhydrase/acetyltransferase-like protein (isoleucine patch superfamily)